MKRVIQARTNLIFDHEHFWGVLALRLNLQEDPTCPTFWTDGKTLGFNPKFNESLTMDERIGVVAHETCHNANGHIWRFPGPQPGFTRDESLMIWNEAADKSINPILRDDGLRLPKGALYDSHTPPRPAEIIFYELCDQYRQSGQKPQGGTFGEIRPDPDKENAQQNKQEWETAVLQAAMAAQARGKLPAGMDELVKNLKNPAVDWKAALRKFLESNARNDFSWAQPNRRYLSMGMYMPCMRSDRLPPVVIGIDTSLSVSSKTLEQFGAEITSIMQEAQPEKIIVMYADAKIHKIEEYEPGDTIEFKFVGRGGTDFRPVLEAVNALEERACCLIYLTDGDGWYTDEPISVPTMWALSEDYEVPWGETIRIREDK